ncbi:MAG TPA: efflux RND transporter periplasmic adaptor subunit [Chitinophagaceae bacterium]|nr:efflux RND transporter periplasmic adaptor subunit [Chitinophagaceae bacterium]
MKKNRLPRLILVLILIGLAVLLYLNKRSKDRKAGAEAKMAGTIPKDLLMDVYVIKPSEVRNSVDATGSLMGNESVDLQPQVSGTVTGINFREGTFITKGTLLVQLFDADLQAQLEKSKMALQLSQLTLNREKKLLSVSGVSQQDVDNALNLVQSNQADMDNIKALIEKTQIFAPFNGIIGLRNISLGATVTPATVIATIVQTDPLKMDFSIPEKYENMLSSGDSLTFTVAEEPHKTFTGKIFAVEPDIDVTTRTVRIRALVPNPKRELHPGSFTTVHLDLRNTSDALMIPTEAIIQTTTNKQVVRIKDRKADLVNVETGVANPDQIQITSGLQAYDTVAITGIMQVKQGEPVKFLSVQ